MRIVFIVNFKIEKKISSIDGRYKTTNNLPIDKIENFPKNISDQLYGLLTPSLRVSYEREYFYLSGMRITFDTSIKYQNYRYFSLNNFNDFKTLCFSVLTSSGLKEVGGSMAIKHRSCNKWFCTMSKSAPYLL